MEYSRKRNQSCAAEKQRSELFDKKQYAVGADKSLKGSLDALFLPLLTLINEKTDGLISTSCCSGRVAIHADSAQDKKVGGRIVYVTHGWLSSFEPTPSPAWDYLCESAPLPWPDHAGVDLDEVVSTVLTSLSTGTSAYARQIEKKSLAANGDVPEGLDEVTFPNALWTEGIEEVALRFEPFVLHIEARNESLLRKVLSLAIQSGFKNSGVLSMGPKRYVVAIRGTGKIDIPLYHTSMDSIRWSRATLSKWIAMCGHKFRFNLNQIRKLETSFVHEFHLATKIMPPPRLCLPSELNQQPGADFRRWGSAMYSPLPGNNLVFAVGGTGRMPGAPEGRLHYPVAWANGNMAIVNQYTMGDQDSWELTMEGSSKLPSKRVYADIARIGCKGLAMYTGGRTGPSTVHTDVWLLWTTFDLKNKKVPICHVYWYRVTIPAFDSGRYRHSMNVLYHPDKTVVDIVGGKKCNHPEGIESTSNPFVSLPKLGDLPSSLKQFQSECHGIPVSAGLSASSKHRHSHRSVTVAQTRTLLLGGMYNDSIIADTEGIGPSIADTDTYYPSFQSSQNKRPTYRASASITSPEPIYRIASWLKTSFKKRKREEEGAILIDAILGLGGNALFYGGGFGNLNHTGSTSDYQLLSDLWMLHLFKEVTADGYAGCWSYIGELPLGDELDHLSVGDAAHLVPQTSMLRGNMTVFADNVLMICGGGGNAFMSKTFFGKKVFIDIFPTSSETKTVQSSVQQATHTEGIPKEPNSVPSLVADQKERSLPTRFVKLGHIGLVHKDHALALNDGKDPIPEIVWKHWAKGIGVTAIGYDAEQITGDYRQRKAQIMYSEHAVLDPWVQVKEGHTLFAFHYANNMFCKGNFIAKDRLKTLPFHERLPGLIGQRDKAETILDLFVGIGYFTAPILSYQTEFATQRRKLQGELDNRKKAEIEKESRHLPGPSDTAVGVGPRMRGYSAKRERKEKARAKLQSSSLPNSNLPAIKHMYCNDWNPDAVLALSRTLKANFPNDKVSLEWSSTCKKHEELISMETVRGSIQVPVTISLGDSSTYGSLSDGMEGMVDRVLLGLIPDSSLAWGSAIRCLKPTGGLMHVHDNASNTLYVADGSRIAMNTIIKFDQCQGPLLQSAVECCYRIYDVIKETGRVEHLQSVELLNTMKVKSFAPRVYHYIYDVLITWKLLD